ncbi:hypothetical protein HanXRQr2_Chr12g0561901 [Helianthus annuus]|uniref:Uncharacterized protein n=1 Tax=Helianthus annuus TaxID=4232 RepID=A0A9K3HK56_HELAN|nr:hypothetical protein HanXRQr2_Chr12g0561901 [Helianthus annuus]
MPGFLYIWPLSYQMSIYVKKKYNEKKNQILFNQNASKRILELLVRSQKF